MQKIKNLLHHNQDANHNGIPDSQERDRNHNGIPDSQERRHNPLDRNHDGKVSLSDLKPGAKTNTIVAPGSTATTTTTTTGAGFLSNDRNMNGIPDNLERGSLLSNDRNMNGIPDNLERRGGLSNDRNMNGIPDNLERGSLLSNDRNMNGIPDNLEGGLATTRLAPTHVEVIEKGVVVHEHIHPVEKEEIQPVIYREREQLDVKQITQQLHETQIQPTLVQQRELAAEVRAPIVERGAPIQENVVLPSVDRDATMRSQVVHAPIVNETIKKTVIEEIQPVLERDIIQSTLIQETKPIYEKIIEAPHVYRETVVVQDRGINGGSLQALSAQGFNLGTFSSNDRNMNGIPDNLERRSGFSNDRNMNGIPDNLERGSGFSNDRNMNGIPDNLERGGLSNDRNMNGIPDNLERRHNPLDRNGDGRVDLKDLTGRPGYGQQGLAGGLSNDRNMNGIPDNLERGNLSNDRNMNGIPDNMERRNPLDRNGDGRVDLKDLSGQPGYGQQGLMGQRTANPLDRNNDGKVDLKDLAPNKAAAPLGSQAPLRTL